MAAPAPPPPEKPDAPEGKPGCMVMFSLPFLVIGGLTILQSLGHGEFMGKALVPNWVLGLAGLVFFCGGFSFVLKAFGAGEWTGKLFGWVILLALGAVFHYAVFADDLSKWSGSRFGPLSAGEFARIFVVTVDLFIVLAWIAQRTTFIGDEPGPLWKKLDGLEASVKKAVSVMILAVPLVLAILLHATGVLDRIGAAFGQGQSGGRAAINRGHDPTRELGDYAGWWGDAHSPFGAGWVTRVIIRVEGNDAWVRLWHSCPPNHCEEGEFKAKVHGNAPHDVRMLEIKRDENGVTRTIELRPNASGSNWLMISEDRIRGRDWNTHQQSVSGMKRVK